MGNPRTVSPEQLSARERQVAALIVAGLTHKQVAEELGLSKRTVDTHAVNIARRWQTRTIGDLCRKWHETAHLTFNP